MAVKLTSKEQQIVEDNINLVHHILKKFPYVQKNYDDYYQAGAYGLCLAVQRYDSSKGIEFSTYASTYITGYIKRQYSDFEQGQVRLPRKVMYGGNEEDKPKYVHFEIKNNAIDSEQDSFNAIDLFLKSEDFESDIITKIDMDKFISSLSEREKQIMKLSTEGIIEKEIGKKLNISQSYVSVIKRNIKEKLKTMLQAKEGNKQ